MDVLGLVVLLLTGFTACAEFGSYAFVHPVVRRLPSAQMIAFEQGLLLTFGRAYPLLMPLCGLMLVVHAVGGGGTGGPSGWRWLAVAAWAIATVTTLAVNVPINRAAGQWDPDSPPEGLATSAASVGAVSGGAGVVAGHRLRLARPGLRHQLIVDPER